MKLKPAEYVILKLGGVRPAARKLNYTAGAIQHWKRNGGHVPTRARDRILKYAKKSGLDITADDLQYGRNIKLEA